MICRRRRGNIARVLKAYNDGCRTTAEVAEETGLPLHFCAVYTVTLVNGGELRKVGLAPQETAKRGGRPNFYEPISRRSIQPANAGALNHQSVANTSLRGRRAGTI